MYKYLYIYIYMHYAQLCMLYVYVKPLLAKLWPGFGLGLCLFGLRRRGLPGSSATSLNSGVSYLDVSSSFFGFVLVLFGFVLISWFGYLV